MTQPAFNVRVYGLLFNESGQILVAEQTFKDVFLRKFPGGGLLFGEGLIDGLKREFREELNMEIDVTAHFYTTDFFVASAFHVNNQVISIYYTVRPSDKEFDYDSISGYRNADGELFLWNNVDSLDEEHFPLPIEKVVIRMLKQPLNK